MVGGRGGGGGGYSAKLCMSVLRTFVIGTQINGVCVCVCVCVMGVGA